MAKLATVFLILISINLWASESCSLKELELSSDAPLVERLFYEGTCHYRNKDYDQSVKLWLELSELEDVEAGLRNLQIDSLNNLGYLLFFGYGTNKDQLQALTYWNKAILLGHTEAEFHLCHAFADSESSTHDPARAISHCEKARLIY